MSVHWDSTLLPALNVRDLKSERLPIIVTYKDQEKLLGVPKLENSSGKEQAMAVWNILKYWGLEDKAQILCSDTTSSNTGRFNGAITFLEQYADREMTYFPCRHHMYELVLRSVFEHELAQVTSCPDIFFKKIREKWNNLEKESYMDGYKYLNEICSESEILSNVNYLRNAQKNEKLKHDYRELIELCLVFMGSNSDTTMKIRPPGALHHARWMAKAIYSFKMFLFRQQLALKVSEVNSLKNICLFLVTVYVKAWLESSSAVGAPFNDLIFLKDLKKYENINKGISPVALNKFRNHLWYLNEESSILAIFDKNVNITSKKRIIENLKRENLNTERKCIIHPNEFSLLLEKTIEDFISQKSLNLLKKLDIDMTFLNLSPDLWDMDDSYLKAQETFRNLSVVNDTAERGVKLIQDFNGLLTVDEEQKQFLLQCVEDHRKQYPDCKKDTLKRKFI